MSVISSGVYRNRFRLIMNPGLKPEGFTYDDSRMPDHTVDIGTAVSVGSVWDGDNRAAHTKFNSSQYYFAPEFLENTGLDFWSIMEPVPSGVPISWNSVITGTGGATIEADTTETRDGSGVCVKMTKSATAQSLIRQSSTGYIPGKWYKFTTWLKRDVDNTSVFMRVINTSRNTYFNPYENDWTFGIGRQKVIHSTGGGELLTEEWLEYDMWFRPAEIFSVSDIYRVDINIWNPSAETTIWIDDASITGPYDSPTTLTPNLQFSDYKSHMTPGIAVLQAGIGDNDDCILSGINSTDPNIWNPVIQPGIFYDLENELYLHSSGSIETIISETNNTESAYQYLSNPRFENWTGDEPDNWTVTPETVGTFSSGYAITNGSNDFISYPYSVELTKTSTGDEFLQGPTFSGVVPGKWYRISYNYKVSGAVGDIPVPRMAFINNYTSYRLENDASWSYSLVGSEGTPYRIIADTDISEAGWQSDEIWTQIPNDNPALWNLSGLYQLTLIEYPSSSGTIWFDNPGIYGPYDSNTDKWEQDKRTVLDFEPLPPHPISVNTFYMDKWGRAHLYENFKRKTRFTGISGLETLEQVANSEPPLYRPNYSGIVWHNVDTSKFEFMVDHTVPEIIRSRNITSGVHATLRKVPYARDKYQIPLVPVVSISGASTIHVYDDWVEYTPYAVTNLITDSQFSLWDDINTPTEWVVSNPERGTPIQASGSTNGFLDYVSSGYSLRLDKINSADVFISQFFNGVLPSKWYRIRASTKVSGAIGDVPEVKISFRQNNDNYRLESDGDFQIGGTLHQFDITPKLTNSGWAVDKDVWFYSHPAFETTDTYTLTVTQPQGTSNSGTMWLDEVYLEGPYEHSGISTQGSGFLTLNGVDGAGTISNLAVYSSGYLRISGNWNSTSSRLPLTPSPIGSFLPLSGTHGLYIDDGDGTSEILYYTHENTGSSTSGNYLVDLTRPTPAPHRNGAKVYLYHSGILVNGSYFTVDDVPSDGHVQASYDVAFSGYDYNQKTGLITIPEASGVPRADLELSYWRGISLCYEPSGIGEYTSRPDININPLVNGSTDGILWFSMFQSKAKDILLSTNKQKDIDNIVGPIYAGNDFLSLTTKVVDKFGAPVANETVSVALDNVQNIGKIDGLEPLDSQITKVTNSNGIANFVYTPPSTIHGLGYFTQFSNIVNFSGLEFAQPFELKELYVNGVWETMTFAVWSDDEYDVFSETPSLYSYTADGRFEIITSITAGDANAYAVFNPVKPIAAFDEDGALLGTSGMVKTLVYTSGQLPTAETDIGAFFVSAEKQVNVGVVAPDSLAASKTLKIKIGIPEFMQGELIFGPIEGIDTRSLDSLAYLTINPYTMGFIDEHRFDPRRLGNVFRIEGSKTDEYLRNKFYIIPDWIDLDSQPYNNEVRKFFTFRNRFILET